MKVRIHGFVAAGAFAIYAAVGAAAFAQPAPAQPAPGVSGPPRAGMMAGEAPAERAARLRDLLQLRPAQEPALQTYTSALDAAHRSMLGGLDFSGPIPNTTPERLARMQQMMAQRQTAMTAMVDATRRFYDQLDAGQKRAFDAMPMMVMHAGLGMMGGPGMMGGLGGPGWMGGPPPPPR